jgi:pyrroloquinoline quinone biosynthesis protein B
MIENVNNTPFTLLLGTAQDGGYPQAGCRRECCAAARVRPESRRLVSSLAIIDPATSQRWIIDCTPNFPEQLHLLNDALAVDDVSQPTGILLTHAHVGHYTGLIQLGREVMAANAVPLYVMPRMLAFLEGHEPWRRIIQDGHLAPISLAAGQRVQLSERLSVVPFLVPHRDEHSETVGFRIDGPSRRVLYLPDIDDWQQLDPPIEQMIAEVDVAYLDGTFFDDGELPGRDMSRIPHPRITDSLCRFSSLPPTERAKIRFIHLNHTNPATDGRSESADKIRAAGCHVAVDTERQLL